jgi:tRNA nucleotidyltransferase (CCA-adding enzyme)
MSINKVCEEVLRSITPTKEELSSINKQARVFLQNLKRSLRAEKISSQVFIGGSFAKGTLLKGRYEIDFFVRFKLGADDKSIPNDIEKSLYRFASKKDIVRLHGSRDYFQIKGKDGIIFEIIPVLALSKKRKVSNVTDLSYSHVAYVKKKLNKNKKLISEILLAKAFCNAQGVYGAESYIHGFSGYALELLIIHYKSFEGFLRAISKVKSQEQIVIDPERHYRTKQEVLMNMNQSKLKSPIILIDPTFNERNALASLSWQTFEGFKDAASRFLKAPSNSFFEEKTWSKYDVLKKAKAKIGEAVFLEILTDRQAGDIAGTKLIKFYKFLSTEIGKRFEIYDSGFRYYGKKDASAFFIGKSRANILIRGPPASMEKAVTAFKLKHKKTFVKKLGKEKRICSYDERKENLASFLQHWKADHVKQMQEMGITELRIIL